MGGVNTTQLLTSTGDPIEQPVLVRGYVSTVRPAPVSFSEPVWVIVPGYSTDRPLGPCEWPAIHGASLPLQGAECVVGFDDQHKPTLVWWAGPRSIEPKPELVSVLPGSPVDGQEVYFQNTTMGTAGVVWHLRYRAASASSHKWEFAGGSPYQNHAEEDEAFTLASSAFVYQDLAKSPNIVIPIAGTYLVSFGANTVLQSGIAGTELDLRLYTSGNVVVTDFTRSYTGVAGIFEWPVFREDKVELAAGIELKMRVAGNQTGASAYRTNARYMRFIPVRVG